MEFKTFEKPKILMIDDDQAFCAKLKVALAEWYQIIAVYESETAMMRLHKSSYDLIFLDIDLPDISGYELLRMIRVRAIKHPVIMLTGNTDLRIAVDCIRAGANDYVVKDPINMVSELRFRIDQIFEKMKLTAYTKSLEKKVNERSSEFQMLGSSKKLMELRANMLNLVGTTASVHITGPSGAGKELVARNISIQEGNPGRPFVAFNCAAVPEHIAENQLFGHTKGGYTGADKDAAGLFFAANNGDIFLDEVGELSPSLQAKLLRVIQEREITPIGSTEVIKLDVRVISATNRNLEEEVREGRFREDLYHRLVVVKIEVPRLRDRSADIPLLAQHFLQKFIPSAKIGSEALAALMKYYWPNNIRELSNCMENASVNMKGRGRNMLLPEDIEFRSVHADERRIAIPASLFPRSVAQISTENFDYACDWVEKKYYEECLSLVGNSRTVLAEKLGCSRSHVQKRIKELGMLDDSPFDRGAS